MNLLPCKTPTVPLFTMKAAQKVLFFRITIVEKKTTLALSVSVITRLIGLVPSKSRALQLSCTLCLDFWEYHLAHLSVFSCLNLVPLSLA